MTDAQKAIAEALSLLPTLRAQVDRLSAELAAERERRATDMQAAYDAGFADSGEGWNGEHPSDAASTESYATCRAEALARINKGLSHDKD